MKYQTYYELKQQIKLAEVENCQIVWVERKLTFKKFQLVAKTKLAIKDNPNKARTGPRSAAWDFSSNHHRLYKIHFYYFLKFIQWCLHFSLSLLIQYLVPRLSWIGHTGGLILKMHKNFNKKIKFALVMISSFCHIAMCFL